MILGILPSDILAALSGSVEQALVIVDPFLKDQPILFASPYFYQYTLYSRDAVIGRNCRFLQGPDTDPIDRMAFRAAIVAQSSVTRTILNYRADGSPFFNLVSIQPLCDPGGRLFCFVGFQNPVEPLVAVRPK